MGKSEWGLVVGFHVVGRGLAPAEISKRLEWQRVFAVTAGASPRPTTIAISSTNQNLPVEKPLLSKSPLYHEPPKKSSARKEIFTLREGLFSGILHKERVPPSTAALGAPHRLFLFLFSHGQQKQTHRQPHGEDHPEEHTALERPARDGFGAEADHGGAAHTAQIPRQGE